MPCWPRKLYSHVSIRLGSIRDEPRYKGSQRYSGIRINDSHHLVSDSYVVAAAAAKISTHSANDVVMVGEVGFAPFAAVYLAAIQISVV